MVAGKIFQTDIYYRYIGGRDAKYDLIFVYQRWGQKVKLLYAELYDPFDQHYIGCWKRENMPATAQRNFSKWIIKKYDLNGGIRK